MPKPVTVTSVASSGETGSQPLSLRAQTKAANRQKIITSARLLFGQNGYEGATLRDIAKAAGLSTGAVFANFADKREIFDLIIKTERERILRVLEEAYDETMPLPKRISGQFLAGYNAGKGNIGMFMSAVALQWNTAKSFAKDISPPFVTNVQLRITYCLTRAIALGEIEGNAPIALAADMFEDLCTANLRRIYFQEIDEADFVARIEAQAELICKAFAYGVKRD
jgi:AcrR family transcriptional regulator